MKKIVIISLIAVSTGSAAYAQGLDDSKVPTAVKISFAKKFPGVTAGWGKENAKEYEAEFKLNGKSASANFLSDGIWVETEVEISLTEVPAAVTAAVQKKYPGIAILKVEKNDDSKGELTYEVKIKKGGKKQEMVLKADGTIVK